MNDSKDKKLENKVVIVTGSGRGIGEAIAIRFAMEGAKVVIDDLNEELGKQVLQKIKSTGGEAIFTKYDISIEEDVKNMVAETISAYGKVDILVNNAGVAVSIPIQNCTLEDYNHVQNIDLKGVWMCCREVVKPFIKNKGGKIINISSIAGIVAPFPNQSMYSAAKGGVIQLTRALAIELCKYDINVNCVAPGFVNTPIYEEVNWSLKIKENIEKLIKFIPFKRLAEPEDITGAVFFLASDDSSYITGQTIFVDGGLTSW